MAKKNILEAAIAEAKQIRETAILNATKQLEENLTPSIKAALAESLERELNEEEETEDLNEDINAGFKEVKAKSSPKKKVNEAEEEDEEAPETDDSAEEPADAESEDVEDADPESDPEEDPELEEPAEEDAPEEDVDVPAGEDEDPEGAEPSDDTPLDKLTYGDLRNLIAQVAAETQIAGEPGGEMDDLTPGGVEGQGDEAAAGDLQAAGEATAEDDAANVSDDEEIDLSEILKELEEESNLEESTMEVNQNGKTHDKGPAKMCQDGELQEGACRCGKRGCPECSKKDKKIKELEEGVSTLRKTLNEVNLLNSKLLYTTRMLSNNNLSESQKVRVIKTLDGAKNVKDVKAAYKTLAESFNLVKESAGRRTLTEGKRPMASRPAGRSTAGVVTVDPFVRRMQELAGIIS